MQQKKIQSSLRSLTSLEAIFTQYSHLPREAIIKQDVLRLGLHFTAEALNAQALPPYKSKDYFIFTFDHVALAEQSSQVRYHIPEEVRICGGIFELRPTIISVRYDPKSPYQVRTVEDRLCLFYEEENLTKVEYSPLPKYYGQLLENGKSPGEIAPVIEWGYLIYLTVFRNCQYFGATEECAFCDINHNYRQQKHLGRPYTGVKSVAEVLETLDAIVASEDAQAKAYTITGGSVIKTLRGKTEEDFYFEYVQAIEKKYPKRWIGKIVTQAWEQSKLWRFREAGIQVYHPNFEVWDKRLFQHLCPGKERTIGRDEWIQRIVDAGQVFGCAGVIPNFVAGVELSQPYGFDTIDQAIRSTTEGLDFFMSQGIIPRFTTWCKEPYTTLAEIAEQPDVALEYFLELLSVWRQIFYKYRLPIPIGYGLPGPGRAVFSVSAFMDVLEMDAGAETSTADVMT